MSNDEADIEALLGRAQALGAPALAVDQPGSLASLVLAVAARLGVPVAYVPGLVMRRAADLHPGEAKTDRRDAFVIADTGRTRHGTRRTGRNASKVGVTQVLSLSIRSWLPTRSRSQEPHLVTERRFCRVPRGH